LKSAVYIVLTFIMCYGCEAVGQGRTLVDTLPPVSNPTVIGDTIPATSDTVTVGDRGSVNLDSLINSSSRDQSNSSNPAVQMSADRPDKPIAYGSVDSSYLDLKQNQIHLYGDAYVNYGKYNLKAGYIIFDFDNNEASAFDSLPSGTEVAKPDFTDGTNTFSATGLRYNFKSNKGIILNAVTQEGEFQVLGSRTKFVSADADSNYTSDQIYNKNAVITTCTNPTPHFGIRSRKLKVMPNRLAVAGVSQLELSGIPTPLILPFGFYPLVDGLSSGIIFPADFDSNPDLGLGVRGVGYYFPISDYLDLTLTGDFYTRGTHRITATSNYRKRYKYNGNVTLRYANNRLENPADLEDVVSNIGLGIRVSHTQDAKAHPYRSVSGTIDISTGDFYSVNFNDYDNATNSTFNSSFNYRNTMPGTPFTFKLGMTHNQNTATNKMNITLPDARLTMTTIYPFKRSVQTGGEKWYEKINMAGSSSFKTFVSTTDSTLFTNETLDNLQTGIYNTVTGGASFKALKYLNIAPNVTMDQYVFARTLDRKFEEDFMLDSIGVIVDQDGLETGILYDTTYGEVVDEFVNGLDLLHQFSTGVTVNTQIFGTRQWSDGWLRGLRHTIKPSLSFNYSPSSLDRRDSVIINDPRISEEQRREYFNPFAGGTYNPSLSGESKSIRLSVVNNFEGKYYSKKDSLEKKFNLFREIRFGTNYNFAADSIKWSPLAFSGNTKLTKYTRLNFNATYNFYVQKNNRSTGTTILEAKNRPVEFDNFNVTLSTSFKLKDIFSIFGYGKKKESSSNEDRGSPQRPPDKSASFLGSLEDFSITHTYRLDLSRLETGTDTLTLSAHNLRVQGNLQLTPEWRVNIQNIQYDFKNKDFVYPSFSLVKDLHCWQMSVFWYPDRNVYGFTINVKSNALNFLKYNYGQQSSNNLGFGR